MKIIADEMRKIFLKYILIKKLTRDSNTMYPLLSRACSSENGAPSKCNFKASIK